MKVLVLHPFTAMVKVMGDADREPVAVILTPEDRVNIASMPPDATIYCAFPGDMVGDKREALERRLDQLKDAGAL